ncbi:MAG: GNAT family N-acyltransferase [Pseudomonadota bacterium]
MSRSQSRLDQSKFTGRFASTTDEVVAAQRLRHRVFRPDEAGERDADHFDDACQHFLIFRRDSGELVACFRVLFLRDGSEIGDSYSAQFYDLSNLCAYSGPMVELGRFCVAPDAAGDPDILRLALGALGAYVEANGVELLFGCSSFAGTEADLYQDAFALLRERHLAPQRWLPQAKAPSVFQFAHSLKPSKPNLKKALKAMPPLLRSYLAIGGWVSDHAVIDRDLNTLHVFTGVEIASIPAARARVLRGIG